MSKKVLTEKEIEVLSNNPYVKPVGLKEITYMDDFNQISI
jgi:transposase